MTESYRINLNIPRETNEILTMLKKENGLQSEASVVKIMIARELLIEAAFEGGESVYFVNNRVGWTRRFDTREELTRFLFGDASSGKYERI